MDINRALANMDDDDPVPQSPSATGTVRLDDFFESADYGLEEENSRSFTKRGTDDDTQQIIMHLPLGRVARISKRQICACKNDAELRALDRSLYVEAGLNPKDFGL